MAGFFYAISAGIQHIIRKKMSSPLYAAAACYKTISFKTRRYFQSNAVKKYL